ncbi:ATP-grasp domain-containing protein [Candidatus Ulvibacter alkanivorans]|uniref:ATP-grasp domain-containing protein n=1 Tax=Candidatus Ulvibacter alkanivorans TaxID=2267620 RepID=UPI000DF24F6E|nr:ATP-grasp domain-containing protein [Candidatus Ulvibacter alkanivorans]
MKNILITGAGALLGQGVLRCLHFAKGPYRIITADPSVHATGHSLADVCYTVPFVSGAMYKSRIQEICEEEAIDIILVGTDVELPFFAEHQEEFQNKYNLRIVVSKKEVIEIANNKYLTAQFLKKNNFPYPVSALTTDAKAISKLRSSCEYPMFAKPYDGARSMGIEVIKNKADLDRICSYENNLVVQEYLNDAEGEFTTGCTVIDGKCAAIVSLTRDLRNGNTWRAFRNGASPYDTTIKEIAEALGVEGPVNFQYRIKDGKPVVFEINCRFSGTTPLRYMFGFNEVEALLEYYLNGTTIEQPQLKDGVVLRTFSDLFMSNEMLRNFEEKGTTSQYETQYFPFKVNA